MKYKDVRAALAKAGWHPVRRRGSHEIWARFGTQRRIVVAGRDSDTVPAGTLASIRRVSGVEHMR
jgi:predicted RNA binding protein YcfA (HicA-like mRNA interferase family)